MRKLIFAAVAASLVSSAAYAREYVSIAGSSTVLHFATIVAEQLGNNPSFNTPVVESGGSSVGKKGVCQGTGTEYIDIGNASSRMKTKELEYCTANGIAVTEIKVGYDGIVVAYAKDAQPLNISKADLGKALTAKVPAGEIRDWNTTEWVDNPFTHWNQINPDFPAIKIEVLGPPPSSGTRDAWSELVMEAGCKTYGWVKELKSADKKKYKGICHGIREDGAYVEAGENDNLIIQKLANNPNAFGIFGYSFLDQNTDVIQGSPIGGVVPTFESIADGSYPASRGLYVYAKKEHMGVIPGMTEFMELYLSDDLAGADGSLGDAGLIPLPQAELDTVRANVLQ